MPSHTKIYEFFPKNSGSPDKNKQILRTTFNQYKTYFKNNLFFNVTTISDDLAVFDCKLLDTALTGVFASVHNNGESLIINVQNLSKFKDNSGNQVDFILPTLNDQTFTHEQAYRLNKSDANNLQLSFGNEKFSFSWVS